jgi:hypothetical protein
MSKARWLNALFVAGAVLGGIAVAQAREVTIASSGGDFQKAQKEVFSNHSSNRPRSR